jgi:acid stress-induced BolA-like protein IbaG/YrbA
MADGCAVGVTTDDVAGVLRGAFADASVMVTGDEGCKHIEVSVISAEFAGKTLLERHKMVLGALRSMLDAGVLHAVSVKAEERK